MLAESFPEPLIHGEGHEGNPYRRKPGAEATGPAVRWAELSLSPPAWGGESFVAGRGSAQRSSSVHRPQASFIFWITQRHGDTEKQHLTAMNFRGQRNPAHEPTAPSPRLRAFVRSLPRAGNCAERTAPGPGVPCSQPLALFHMKQPGGQWACIGHKKRLQGQVTLQPVMSTVARCQDQYR